MTKLSVQDYDYRRPENSISSINYHFVFVPKRRQAVLVGDIATRMQSIIFDEERGVGGRVWGVGKGNMSLVFTLRLKLEGSQLRLGRGFSTSRFGAYCFLGSHPTPDKSKCPAQVPSTV